jgi:hypothetical protein
MLGAAEDHVAHDPERHPRLKLPAGDAFLDDRESALRIELIQPVDGRLPILR